MSQFVGLNGKIIKAHRAKIAAASPAALYGRGVFTTIAIANGNLFLWQAHWRRLLAHAEQINLATKNISETEILATLAELIAVNKIGTGRARISLFETRSGALWKFDDNGETQIFITAASKNKAAENLKLTMSPFRINSASSLVGIKSCNYLDHLLALEAAQKQDFNEAIRLNERGETTSACLANVFWLKNEKLFTPALSTGALAGTTRAFVLNAAQALKLECTEIVSPPQAILAAEAVFLTSAGIGVVAVQTIENNFYDSNHAIVNRLSESLKNAF